MLNNLPVISYSYKFLFILNKNLHLRFLFETTLLLLLQGCWVGIWWSKPRVEWISAHKLWAKCSSPIYVPWHLLVLICSVQPIETQCSLQMFFKFPLYCRLVTLQEWCDVNPANPLTQIVGWSPWRILAAMCITKVTMIMHFSFKTTTVKQRTCPSTWIYARNSTRYHAHLSPRCINRHDH